MHSAWDSAEEEEPPLRAGEEGWVRRRRNCEWVEQTGPVLAEVCL